MNRESIGCNMTMEQANEILMLAKQGVHSAQYATYKSTKIKSIAASVKNEVMEMIAKSENAKADKICRKIQFSKRIVRCIMKAVGEGDIFEYNGADT